jgi:ribulose-5-phosphate 4-epimerase/fuculose-1-phosphate aldolase
VLPPLIAYHVMRVGKLPLLPYYRPGDRKLAGAVRIAATEHRAMLLANYGPIVSGKTLAEAVHAYENWKRRRSSFSSSLLTCEAIDELNTAFGS